MVESDDAAAFLIDSASSGVARNDSCTVRVLFIRSLLKVDGGYRSPASMGVRGGTPERGFQGGVIPSGKLEVHALRRNLPSHPQGYCTILSMVLQGEMWGGGWSD